MGIKIYFLEKDWAYKFRQYLCKRQIFILRIYLLLMFFLSLSMLYFFDIIPTGILFNLDISFSIFFVLIFIFSLSKFLNRVYSDLIFPLVFISLFFFLILCYCNAQAQSNYIIPPACNDSGDKPLVIFFTGDSGRSSYDKKLTDSLCLNNMPLMAINSYKYFLKRKTPQQTLDSILPYIDLNLKKYNRQKIILIGYSFGSEVVPFLYNLMNNEWKNKVECIVLLSPSDNSDFKIHFLDQVGLTFRHWHYDVLSEIMKIDDKKIIVFWGEDEKKFKKEKFTKHNITVHHLKGSHVHTEVAPVIEKINEHIKAQAFR